MACILGIDLGTTTIKAVLVECNSYSVVEEHSEALDASVIDCNTEGRDEQDVMKILSTLNTVLGKFPLQKRQEVIGIGVSGQMHGVAFWHSSLDAGDALNSPKSCTHGNVSPLITWRDGRCTDEFLSPLCSKTSERVSTGYGCCTLLWLQQFNPRFLEGFDRAGTIMDFLVYLLCRLNDVVMSSQNAYSWGYFDSTKSQWKLDTLKSVGFPICFLPTVKPAPSLAGSLRHSWLDIPSGTPVGIAMGDLQCSIYSVQPTASDAIFNIGTASQLSVIKPASIKFDADLYPSLMEVPYFNDSTLVVAASLTGGNALGSLVNIFKELLQCLDLTASDEQLYSVLIEAAGRKMDTTLQVDPVLLGERYLPGKKGSAGNITSENVTLGDIVSSVLRGVVLNMETMMSQQLLEALKVKRLVGCGSALCRNTVLLEHIRRVFGRPVTVRDYSGAPFGAALVCRELFGHAITTR